MARSILRAGKIAGVVIVAIIVVAAVLYSAGVLSIAQTDYPPPETTGSPEPLPPEPTSEPTLAEQRKLVIACLTGDEPAEAAAAMDKLLTDFAQHKQLPGAVHDIVQRAVKAGKYEAVGEVCRGLAENSSVGDNGVWVAMASALAAAYQGDDEALDAATENLAANHSDDPRCIESFGQIAWSFRERKKYAKARQFYQYVVDTWPNGPRAVFSQRGLVLTNLELGETDAASAALDELLSDYGQDPDFVECVAPVAQTYRKKKQFDIAIRIHEFIADNRPDDPKAIWSQRAVVDINVTGVKDDAAAEAAYETLLERFGEHEKIAKAVGEVAWAYRRQKRYADSLRIYREVWANWPDSDSALIARQGIVLSLIGVADAEGAGAEAAGLLADYKDDEGVAVVARKLADEFCKKKLYQSAIGIYEFLADNRADDPKAIWLQLKRFNIALVKLKDDAQADAAYETLLERFGAHDEIAKVVGQAAWAYRRQKRYADSLRIYRQVLANWPDSDSALVARRGIVFSLIGLADAEGADAEVAGLLADYEDAEGVAAVALQLGDEFRKKKLYESALGLYEYVADNYAESKQAITAQRKVVTTHINLKDEPAAQQALDELTLRFADDPKLSRELYEVGEYYRSRKKYAHARGVYQSVIDDWPGTAKAMWSAQRQIVIDIDEAEDPNDPAPNIPPPVLTKVDNLIADFEGQPELTRAVFFVGEEYYRNGHKGNFGPVKKDAKRYWPRAVKLWEKVIDANVPFHDNYTPEAWFLTGVCYSRMNDAGAALPYLQKVLADWPDYKYAWDAQVYVGVCYEQLKRANRRNPNPEYDQAIEDAYTAVLENYGDCTLVFYANLRLAELKYKQERWQESAMHAEQYLTDKWVAPSAHRASVLYKLGQCYENMGEPDSAQAVYEQHMTEFPDTNLPSRSKVLDRLAALKGGAK